MCLRFVGCRALFALTMMAGCGAGEDNDAFEDAAELEPGGALGKADGVGIPGLPVGTQAEVWAVLNQWEDTDTAAARAAGIAWPADSGLNWDEKYQAWVQSLPKEGGTFALSTPFDKTLPAPKLDCADVALALRASFAAWYNLPFFMVSFDKGEPVYFGHFGIRTRHGRWNGMPNFTQFSDHSDMPPEQYQAQWPEDSTLRKRGVQAGDDQPFLGEGARTGTYLDEIHLNKRAGRFIRLMLIFNGSMNLADSRNTFNLAGSALKAGDPVLWRWQALGVGHTMMTIRVDEIADGKLEAQSVWGNLPPTQPTWDGPIATKRNYTDEQGGGRDETTDYAPFNGGVKRFRVAKNLGGRWTNTWMKDDESSWINDNDHDAMHARIDELELLLGEVTPEEHRVALLGVIEQKREHLRNFPASCSARIKREKAFDDLYAVMEEHFGTSSADVDAEFRTFEDYVFAELVYEESKTCCWNSTTATMYETIMDLNHQRQEEAGDACVQPIVFKAVDGDYDAFRQHNSAGWVAWSEDESCPQRNVQDDAEAMHGGLEYCAWKEITSGDSDAPPSEGGESCAGACGGQSSGECWCDDQCASLGDCCDDYHAACE